MQTIRLSSLPGLRHQVGRILLTLGLAIAAPLPFALVANAQVPDLTAGGVITDTKYWNLGPTGMTGWFYHVGASTDQSRQIQVATVDVGSPADGILAVGDVILGVDGTGANPVNFTADARKSFGYAIADAEASTPATLKLLRWRSGIISTVSITLETLGAYSATAPYNCPKSAAILEKGLDAVMANGGTDNFKFSLVTLLAGNDPSNPDNIARMARAQQEAHELILTQAEINSYINGDVLTTSKIAWNLGFRLLAISEYYMATADAAVYDSMRAYAIAYAKGQSMFGTGGHQFAKQGADGSINGPYGVGYGVVNSANMQCFYGLLLAREAGVIDQRVEDAIERSARFYGSYVDRGSIPYGEHKPGGGHESNGKMGIAALTFKHITGREYDASYFVKMAGASAKNRDTGHTGPYLNYLWAPLGANAGGEESMASYFAEQSWHYDLSRNWDGSFEYNTYGQGSNGGPTWSQANLQMSTTALLSYATPLRQTYITGKNADATKWLNTTEVDAVEFATTYDATSRTTTELLNDLGSWSPPTRWGAAREIGNRTAEHASLLPTLHTMATDTAAPVPSRMGACFALGKILDDSSVPVLVGLLTDNENLVSWAAGDALPAFSDAAQLAEIDTMLSACITTAKPLLPLYEDDPIHLAHGNIVFALFGSGSAGSPRGVLYSHDLVGIDRGLLLPAIRAAAANPTGLTRSAMATMYSKLTREELQGVADAVVEGTMYEAPADRMFSGGIRKQGLEILEFHNFSEGVPLSKKVFAELRGDQSSGLTTLENYAGSSLKVLPDPQIVEFCEYLIASDSYVANAQAVLDAIAADQLPEVPTPLKGISWIFPDKAELTLPEGWTTLRAHAYDHAMGNPVFTWRKVHGAGEVTFSPNGTAAAKDAAVVFDGTPGEYLFEVTMSDQRGLTEVSKTVSVRLNDTGGTVPANSPPTANAQAISIGQGTPSQIILTGSDPEGYELNYSVLAQPVHGVLSGSAPNLVYTSDANYTGPDSFTFEVMDSEGQIASATIDITVGAVSDVGLAVYEPFDYPAGPLNGSSGTTEVGLDGSWTADSSINLVAGSLEYGTLLTAGNSIGNLSTSNSFGGARAVSSGALVGNGLLNDGATLWFSVVVGPGPQSHDRNIYLALANHSFNTGLNNHWIDDDGAQVGSGVGIHMAGNRVYATEYTNASFLDGSWDDSAGLVLAGQHRLVIGKITWGATSDTIDLYLPKEDMILPNTPSSSLSVNVDQSIYDTLTFERGKDVIFDEIRLGATYQSVLQGTTAMSADLTAPTPDPMSFASAPAASGPSSISMVASTAYDPLGVEYYFTCTAGGGNDSGWQESASYTDTGLTAGTAYSYSVRARDKTPGNNETVASSAGSATIPVQTTVPGVVGILQESAESLIVDADLTVGTVTTATAYSLSVPAGHVMSQTPSGASSASYGSAVDLVISIGEDPALPDLASVDIVDDQAGGPVVVNTLMTFTLTFSEDIDLATVDSADFTNAGDATITIGAIAETSAGVFTVEVTPTSTGLLRFAVAQGATISDIQAEALNTTSAIIDNTAILINLADEIVPNVVGLDQATAESNLVAGNFVVGDIYQIYDETVPVGNVISQSPAAGASVPGQSPVDLVVSLGTPPDTTGPVIAAFDPADGTNSVEVNDVLKVYFDEDIMVGSGLITIRNLSDYTESTISVTDTTQVSISGVVMTINPTADFLAGKSYAIRMAPGIVEDFSGNAFNGINDNLVWNFTTALSSLETVLFTENFESPDVTAYSQGITPPDWVPSSQGFNAAYHGLTDKAGGDFDAADPNHQAYAFRYGGTGITTLEGEIATIAEGDIYEVEFDVIRDDGMNAGTAYTASFIAYNLGDARNDVRSVGNGTELSKVTGNATDNGSFSTVRMQYTVPVGAAFIGKDLAVRFVGGGTSAIIDNVAVRTLSPDPGDVLPPAVAHFNPEDDSSSFPVEDNLVVSFNEDIVLGSGEIVLKDLTGSTSTTINVTDGSQVIAIGGILTINPTENLLLDHFYAVQIPGSAIFDLAGNNFPGISSDTLWSFTTGEVTDFTAPSVVSFDPANGASDVPYGSNLNLNFDENVVIGSGNITLSNLTDSTQVVIDVADSGQVLAGGSTVTINPANYFGEGKNYAVQVDAGAILDLSGNAYAGISDDTTWSFSVSATNPPVLVSTDPADEAISVDLNYTLSGTFDEAIVAGVGNIILRNLSEGTETVIDVTDASQVSITTSVLSITPTNELAEGTSYAVLIEAGAVTDLDGNAFAGINDQATWNFMSGVSSLGTVFYEDFEVASGSPDVDSLDSLGATSKETGPNWVRASEGYRADYHGVIDESSGQFTDPTGEQAYAFRYGSSGITSVEGSIGALTLGAIYEASFYVVADGLNAGDSYKAQLVTFDAGAARTGIVANESMVLAEATGTYAGSGYQLISFQYTSNGVTDSAVVGHDVALRFVGAGSSANIDNVRVTVIEDVTVPTLTSSDVVDDRAGATIVVNNPVTYTLTFSEDMNGATLDATDLGNAGTAAFTIDNITETAPGVFTVIVTPTTPGSLQLQVIAGAVITDVAGNQLDTISAIADDTTISVIEFNYAPVWTVDPINEIDATEDVAYSATLVDDASDANGQTLDFVKVSGPAWLIVAIDGTLSGTPANSDVGANAFTVSVSDNIADPVEAQLNITVINVNDVPVWTSDPLAKQDAEVDSAYSATLAVDVTDDDAADVLTFAKISGPAWLNVAADGALSGMPAIGDLGANAFTVSVSDGVAAPVEVDINIWVNNVNNLPVFTANPFSVSDATEDAAYAGTISGSASDVDNDPLVYAKVAGPVWLNIGADGTLSGTPVDSDVGANVFTVSVSDNRAAPVEATLNITVINTNDAPVFVSDPIIMSGALETVEFSGSLAGFVSDDDDDTLIFSKVSGPAWLSVAANGDLSGTPADTDLGVNVFTVSASDEIAPAVQVTLELSVKSAPELGVAFADGFEPGVNTYGGTTPDVTTYSLTNTSGQVNTVLWVRSAVAFGSDRSGLVDETEDSGTNFTDPVGTQAHGLRYTSSGLTTQQDLIGALVPGYAIDVSFDVVKDGFNGGLGYDASLVLFDAGASRSDVSNYNSGTKAVLARVSGSVADNGNYNTVTFSYTVGDLMLDNNGDASGADTTFLSALVGKDIALRFDGATSSANIDNVEVFFRAAQGNAAPEWTANPLSEADATEGLAYSATLADDATDAENNTLTFAKVGGPAWLTVAGNGDLGGTPVDSDVGANAFTVSVSDGVAEAVETQLNITVINVNSEYAVSYDANAADSGTVPGDQIKIEDTDLTLATNTGNLARNGYDFIGWNTAADGTGTDYTEGSTYSLNAAVVLYAKWLQHGVLDVTSGNLVSTGSFGGPFSPSSLEYTLQNTGSTPLDWTVGNLEPWVSTSAAGGTLAVGVPTTVTVSINAGADVLDAGGYIDTVSFTNTTNGNGNTTRSVNLTVEAIPAAVTLGGLNQTYDGTAKSVSVATDPAGLAYSVTYDGSATAPVDGGSYAVVATVTELGYGGSASDTLVIAKAAQTISFAALDPVAEDIGSFELTATATSGLTVSYTSSNPSVATISGSTVTIVSSGDTIITASQPGDGNYLAAADVSQTLNVFRPNPVVNTGGPYKLFTNGSLSLDGSASIPSDGAVSISSYEWDLNNDGIFGDVTGATPAATSIADLTGVWGMSEGANTIQLKVTDSDGKTSTGSTTVSIILSFVWDANAGVSDQPDGGAAWLGVNQWWDGSENQNWPSGSNAVFGNGGNGGSVYLSAPTSVGSITLNAFGNTYQLGSSAQTLTIDGGVANHSASGAVDIISPVIVGGDQTWENNSTEFLTIGDAATSDNINNGGFTVTADGTGKTRVWGSLSGSGGLIKNGSGILYLGGQYQPSGLAHSYTGTTTINEGSLWIHNTATIGSGNLIINGGVFQHYYGGTFSRGLGAGDNQFQIIGGISGFSIGNSGTVRVNDSSSYELVWGSTYFKPDELVLQAATAGSNNKLTLSNKIDLNGLTRTIRVDQTGGDLVNGYALISGIIRNTSGTAGITKTGIGQLILNAANTYNGDTTVLGGNLRINVVNNQNETSTVSIAASATLQLNFTGTDTVNKLFIDGSEMSAGEYKAVGSAASGTELAQLTGTGTLTVISGPYESWSSTYGLTGEETLASAILHSDGLANLQKFAFGMDPTVANSDRVEFVVGGEVTAAGSPALMNMAAAGQADDERAVFTRLKNHVAAGLTYTVEFSADLKVWAASAATPTVLTDANSTSDLEVVSVPFVDSVPVDAGGAPRPPKFMRVVISNE